MAKPAVSPTQGRNPSTSTFLCPPSKQHSYIPNMCFSMFCFVFFFFPLDFDNTLEILHDPAPDAQRGRREGAFPSVKLGCCCSSVALGLGAVQQQDEVSLLP